METKVYNHIYPCNLSLSPSLNIRTAYTREIVYIVALKNCTSGDVVEFRYGVGG